MLAVLNLTIHPFREGEEPPAHVLAVTAHLQKAGLGVQVEPFGITVTGDHERVLASLPPALQGAISEGARRILISLEVT